MEAEHAKRVGLAVDVEVEAGIDAALEHLVDDEVERVQVRQLITGDGGRAAVAEQVVDALGGDLLADEGQRSGW